MLNALTSNDPVTNHKIDPATLSIKPEYDNPQDVLARHPSDAPKLLFSPSRLREQAQLFLDFFPGQVTYAVKANPHPLVMKTLVDGGIQGFDVASINEVRLAKAFLPTAELHFNNPIKTDEAVRESYEKYDVRSFVVDDLAQIEQILEICQPLEEELELTVRFTLPADAAAYDFGSKFGAKPEEVAALISRIQEAKQHISLTFHPGSQCKDPLIYKKYIATAAELAEASNATVISLNVGGGFPVPYVNYEVESVVKYCETIKTAFENSIFAQQGTLLVCEPGRAMVADSMSVIAKVLHTRVDGSIFINDGLYGSFQEQMIVDLELPSITWKVSEQGIEQSIAERQKAVVFGPTCDPTDALKPRMISSDTAKGDFMEFGLMGSYSNATATNFNGFELPEMLLVDRHSYMRYSYDR